MADSLPPPGSLALINQRQQGLTDWVTKYYSRWLDETGWSASDVARYLDASLHALYQVSPVQRDESKRDESKREVR